MTNSKIVVPSSKNLQKNEKEEKEEKTKNARIATKIDTMTKFGITNSKIAVSNLQKQRIDHTYAPPLQNDKMIVSL